MHTILKQRPSGLLFGDRLPPGPRIGQRLFGALRPAVAVILTWRARRAQRIALAHLEDRLLKDIGLTRTEAAQEARRPFWRG